MEKHVTNEAKAMIVGSWTSLLGKTS